ncbi:ATP-binding cassette domain-containing protein [Faecalicoccus acidiformans]|uniref:ATP-binding cassette domain-containing protein n=1 Tax=Faecalicoccus acidiformans TaxID=915173 RepID=UPI0025A34A80|nr:ATP-binding cassette domain-containing protein [Faecalicoccus acidiformans]MDM8203409.1 ATP-binding cassette domain-containing protein [Faecalicoccus acidiformans]
MIEIKNVIKRFENGVDVLGGISVQIPERKRTVLFGPSGCGKTTLLRILAGLETATAGEISFPVSYKISFMFQRDSLFDPVCVFENIAYGIDQRTLCRDQLTKRVHSLAALVGVESILMQKTESLSGGQRQRVSLARALMKEPDLLLIDEGFNSLDRKTKNELIDKLIQLQEEKKFTLLYVTHDIQEARRIGQNFIEFKKEEATD